MSFDLTAFDLMLLVILAGVIAIGVRRGVAGLVAGLGTLVFWPLLNLAGFLEPLLAFVLAFAAGLLLGQVARVVHSTGLISASSDAARAVMGGVGGLIMGLGLVLALTMSFPTRTNFAQGTFFYPSDRLPSWLFDAVNQSAIQRLLTAPQAKGGLDVWRASMGVRAYLVPDRNRQK